MFGSVMRAVSMPFRAIASGMVKLNNRMDVKYASPLQTKPTKYQENQHMFVRMDSGTSASGRSFVYPVDRQQAMEEAQYILTGRESDVI